MYKGVHVSWHFQKNIFQTVLFKRETSAMVAKK
jgi:hypothetical protein